MIARLIQDAPTESNIQEVLFSVAWLIGEFISCLGETDDVDVISVGFVCDEFCSFFVLINQFLVLNPRFGAQVISQVNCTNNKIIKNLLSDIPFTLQLWIVFCCCFLFFEFVKEKKGTI